MCIRDRLYYEGLFNEAMRDLDVAETLAFRMNDSLLIANVFNMKGLLHENIQNGQLAIPFLEKALQWFPRDPRPRYPLTEPVSYTHLTLPTSDLV